MNPFKQKELSEFTIDDCEFYIRKYPYGEHTSDVKKRLVYLRKHTPKPEVEQIDIKTGEIVVEEKSEGANEASGKKKQDEKRENIVKEILLWIGCIGCIVIVFVLGVKIYFSLPDKLRFLIFLIYFILIPIINWIRKKLDW